jgi:hypothetical protein
MEADRQSYGQRLFSSFTIWGFGKVAELMLVFELSLDRYYSRNYGTPSTLPNHEALTIKKRHLVLILYFFLRLLIVICGALPGAL